MTFGVDIFGASGTEFDELLCDLGVMLGVDMFGALGMESNEFTLLLVLGVDMLGALGTESSELVVSLRMDGVWMVLCLLGPGSVEIFMVSNRVLDTFGSPQFRQSQGSLSLPSLLYISADIPWQGP